MKELPSIFWLLNVRKQQMTCRKAIKNGEFTLNKSYHLKEGTTVLGKSYPKKLETPKYQS